MGKASNAKKDRAAKIAASGYGKKPFNWLPVLISGIAVFVVIAFAAASIFINQKAAEPSVAPSSNVTIPADIKTAINKDTGEISIGEAPTVLEEFLDFGCPYCGDYNATYGEDVRESLAAGDITLKVSPVAILDSAFQGTKFSTRAASSLYCVAENEPNSVLTYIDNLYENQPREGTSGLTDDKLVEIAKLSNATAAENCIRDLTYGDFVGEITKKVQANDWFRGTPTIRFDGTVIDFSTLPDKLASIGS